MKHTLLLIMGMATFVNTLCSQGLETFTNMPPGANTSQYETKNWTGDGGISWTSTDTRGDQSITGLAAGFRNATLSSGNISGGVGNLSFKYKYIFSGSNASLTVRVNGNIVGTVSITTSQTTPATASISNINIAGVFVLSIQQTVSGQRVAIDDLTWTAYSASSCTPPGTQATSALITGVTNTSMDIGWTNGSGTNSLVVVKAGSAVTGAPINGTAYSANASFGSGQIIAAGEYAVYSGTANTVSVTGLSAGTTYYTAVYSFNVADNCYNIVSPATATTTTTGGGGCPEPTTQASTITVNASAVSGTINWTAGSGSNSLVKLNTTNSFIPPADGVVYAANAVYTGGEQVIYNGAGTTMAVTGLSAGTTYYVTVYTYNPCSGTPNYLVSSNSVKTFATLTNGGIPANYYNSAAGLSCAPLKTALRGIVNTGFIHRSYDDLWTIYQTGDIQPSELATGNVIWDIYSDYPTGPDPYEFTPVIEQCGTYNSEGDCYNREHSFPSSWFNDAAIPGSDYHHIFPTDGYVNNRRSNYPYGRVGTATYSSANGSKLGTSTWTGVTGTVFEPIDEYKGDVARALFYMVTCYQNNMSGWENNNTNGDIVMDGTTWPSIEPAYLQMMMNWHNLDPVSQKEIDRNNAGYGFQVNRNPFVDHPEYVEMIWGVLCSVLPVDIISFTGKYHSGTVLLNWNIANADRFSRFEVERSTDGRNFVYAGKINYDSNSDEYLFSDAALYGEEEIYYRLKLVDVNGSFRYSQVVMVAVPATKGIAFIYPNPVNEVLQFSFSRIISETFTAKVTDLSGRTMLNAIIPAGQNKVQLMVHHLPSGVYVLSLSSAQGTEHLRFVKQ